MKIVGEYLVVLPIFEHSKPNKIYKVVETITGKFYREQWNNGNITYKEVDPDVFFEENSKESLVVSK